MSRRKHAPREQDDASLLLERLHAGLAEAELQRVLACSLLAHDEQGRARLYERLGAETATVVRSLLQLRRRPGPEPAVLIGKAKIKQDWDSLWSEWQECVLESGDEQGRYVTQEHHWEPPYFCADSLSSDLDDIAKRMQPLLARVQRERVDPNLSLFEQVRHLDEEVGGGLPDYVREALDGVVLGPEATSLVLQWEYGPGAGAWRTPFGLVDALCQLEMQLRNTSFDHAAVRRFVWRWPANAQREVVSGISRERTGGHWGKALANAYSGWFRFTLDLARRWDEALHTELCVANVSRDWSLAVPVVSDMVKRKDYGRAAVLVGRAFGAMLRLEGQEGSWDPRSSLLVLHRTFDHDPAGQTDAARLLRAQRRIAKFAGKVDSVAAVDLQLLALQDPDDGDAMVEAFQAMTDVKLGKVRKRLLAEWRELVARRTLGGYRDSTRDPRAAWVAALADAAVSGPEAAARLRGSVRSALTNAVAARQRSVRGWPTRYRWEDESGFFALARLTLDLDADGQLSKTGPALHKLLKAAVGTRPNKLDRIRAEWFKKLGGKDLQADAMRFWREQAASFVPEPALSSYQVAVDWLAAARQLDPASGDRILADWAARHRLKRNLWKAVRDSGLPVPGGVRVG